MKPAHIKKFGLAVVCFVTCVSVNSFADSGRSQGTIFIPEINRTVRYEKDSNTKEFALDYRDLIDFHLDVASSQLDGKTCKDWRAAAKASDKSQYAVPVFDGTPIQFKLKVFDLNPAAMKDALGADWTNVSEINSGHMKINYVWRGGSDVLMAGPATEYAIEKDVDQSLNTPQNHSSINSTGYAEFSSRYPIFACDLLNGDVSLSLTYTGYQQGDFQIVPAITPMQISQVSQQLASVSSGGSSIQYVSGESVQALNAAGLLGFELSKQNVSKSLFQNGNFLLLYNDIFKDGANHPQTFSLSQSQDILKSMIQVSATPQWLTITHDLGTVSE